MSLPLVFPAVALTLGVLAPARGSDSLDRYIELVTAYAAGDRSGAVAGIGTLDEEAVRFGLASLRGRPLRLARAALMLHTDRRHLERFVPGRNEVTSVQVQCAESAHVRYALQAAQILLLTPDGRDFARRFFHAVALQDRLDECFEEAIPWIDVGAQWFPTDPAILLTRGMIYESLAAREARQREPMPPLGSRAREAHLATLLQHSERFRQARLSLERAAAADPTLGEARLRLGRVLWHLGKGDEARAVLEALIERAPEATTLHVARMFLGRIHQDAGREEAALREYRAALALQRTSQPAAIALGEALQLAGEPQAARATVEAALALAGQRQLPQSIWEYEYGQSRLAPELLQGLREDIQH